MSVHHLKARLYYGLLLCGLDLYFNVVKNIAMNVIQCYEKNAVLLKRMTSPRVLHG